jgi:uncharacterized protein with PIN domain
MPSDVFDSEYEDRPFIACTRCGEELVSADRGYQVVKYWHHGEVTYEYALCHGCHQGLLNEFSKESRDKLEKHHQEHFDLTLGLGGCATCGQSGLEMDHQEYSVTALYAGAVRQQEILVCGACSREMQGLMSDKTRGVWEKFLGENFPTAPADVAPEPTVLVPAS